VVLARYSLRGKIPDEYHVFESVINREISAGNGSVETTLTEEQFSDDFTPIDGERSHHRK